jgi:hypothetical protein
MNTSKFIARIYSIAYLSVGFGYIASGSDYQTMFEGFSEPSIGTFLFAIIILVAGMAIVNYHNIWVRDWRVLITIFGWITLIKGVFILILPTFPSAFVHFMEVPDYFMGAGIFSIILGAIFGHWGFFYTKSVVTEESH